MATHHGKDGTVKVGSDTLGEIKDFSLNISVDTAEDSAMGDSWKTHLVGMKEWDGDVTCHWDLDDTAQMALDIGASVTLALYPEGATSGDKFYTGTASVVKIGVKTPMGDVVEQSFSFRGNGALTESTVGA
jgi:hypothetical protein